MSTHIVLVDNHDSFSFNLVEEFRRLDCTVEVWRADRTAGFLLERGGVGSLLVLSPGPGTPEQAGCCIELVQRAHAQHRSVLGICLGHQAITVACGGEVGLAPTPVHGRASRVQLAAHPLFHGLGPTTSVGRYHSLAATVVPAALEVTARTEDGVVMAVVGRDAPLVGLQFHPESILTPEGSRILSNALGLLRPRTMAAVA